METNTVEVHKHRNEPWKVTMLYTGPDTMTGGRLLRAQEVLGNERFMLTYGDGVSDVNIPALLANHEKTGKSVTVTAIQPIGKFGALGIDEGNLVRSFTEKPADEGTWINGGFFVMEPAIFRYLNEGDRTILERAPLSHLAQEGQLNAYKHTGFWKAMDTLNDKNILTEMWTKGKAPWALWQQ
jgi:glucose-1-phosphate cytidylyltransferase